YHFPTFSLGEAVPLYMIQKRIHTLLEFGIASAGGLEAFTRHGIRFSPWEADISRAWQSRFWIAESQVNAASLSDAWKPVQDAMTRIVSRMAFIGQAYHTDLGEPYLIRKDNSPIAFFRYSTDREPVPLMFTGEELEALDKLLAAANIPDAFYLYWN